MPVSDNKSENSTSGSSSQTAEKLQLEEKLEKATAKEHELLAAEKDLARKERQLAESEEFLQTRIDEEEQRLSEIAGLTAEEAKARLFAEVEAKTRHESAKMIREDFLQQNSFADNDAYSEYDRQARMLAMIRQYDTQCLSAAERGGNLSELFAIPAREKIGRAIVSGKDGVAGRLSSKMSGRLAKAEAELSKKTVSKRYDHRIGEFGVTARSSCVAHLEASRLSAGEFSIDVPELWISPTDHVVLTGANGTGKSLVVRSIIESVPDNVKVAYVPQDVGPEERERALRHLRDQDQETKGRILSIVARLNSDPDRLLDGDDLSPGELRKLMLAEQLVTNPNFLVLDEPTNHLDVGSIEALQEMLSGFSGALLLVTHDRQLSEAVTQIGWETIQGESLMRLLVV